MPFTVFGISRMNIMNTALNTLNYIDVTWLRIKINQYNFVSDCLITVTNIVLMFIILLIVSGKCYRGKYWLWS